MAQRVPLSPGNHVAGPGDPVEPSGRAIARQAPEGLTQIVVRGVGIAGAGYLATQLLTIAAYLVLARLVTPTEMGVFAAGSLVVIGALFAESGMLAALIHRRDRVEEAAATAVIATITAGFAFALAGLAVSPLIGLFFDSRDVGLVAAALSGYVLVRQAAVVPEALLQRRFSFLRRLVAEPASVVAFGATAILGAASGLGVWALVAGTYAAVVTQAAAAWALVRWRPDLRRASFALWRELVGYGKHITAAGLVRVVTSETGTIFVGRFLGAATLGQFHYTYRIAQRPLAALVSSVTYVVFPAFARIADDQLRFERAFLRTVRWLSVVALPVSLILLPLGEPAVVVLFGERWREGGIALTWMFGYTAGWAFVSLAEHVAKSVGRPEVVLRLDIAAMVAAVSAVAALVQFGLVGVAAALSLSAIAAAGYSFLWIVRMTDIPLRRLLREVWPATGAAVVMAGSLYALDRLLLDAGQHSPGGGLAVIALEVVVGAIVYLAMLGALAPQTAAEVVKRVRARGGRTGSMSPGPPE
jgi:O-antigen/teichoic acid export membrane protein